MKDWLLHEFITSHKATHTYNSLEFLYKEGETVEGVYHLKRGQIATFKQYRASKILLNLYDENQIIGLGHMKSIEAIHSAVALRKVELDFFPRKAIEDFANHNFDFSIKLFQTFCKEIDDVEKKRVTLLNKSTKQHLVHLLLMMIKHDKNHLNTELSINYLPEIIAFLSDITIKQLNKILLEFERKGWIHLEGDKIKILASEQLELFMKN